MAEYDTKLAEWVMDYIEEWRDHRDTNYETKWREYERMWRGEWSAADRLRDSERSRVVSPALQQAIESHSAEIEEAVFGQSQTFFDIDDDFIDREHQDVEYLKNYMTEQFKKNRVRKAIGDIILNASVYGTGIGEIVLKETTELVPASQPLPNVQAQAVGVEEKKFVSVSLRAISPMNFLIDPNATTIEEAMGCAVEEFVSAHVIAKGMVDGIYNKVDLDDDATPDDKLEPTGMDTPYSDDKLRVVRYYGLVPAYLLTAVEGEFEDITGKKSLKPENENESEGELIAEYGDMVEALVVIVNGSKTIKAERSPYMMQDRPIVAYQDDSLPGRFWGRGIAEKGYNMQKSVDAQLRSHLDSLALTTVPMMGIDATRLPRGSKFEVRPGKTILTNGNPAEILQPFKFGNTDSGNITTAQQFERMLLQATGTLDTAGLPQMGTPDGGMSLALSGLLKRNKRTLVNFQDSFLIPFVTKTAYRFMQFDPDNFPVRDWKFVPSSSLGMLAREVEQMQFINLLKTLGPDSPVASIVMMGVISNSSLSNREELIAMLKKQQEPDPQQQQIQQVNTQLEFQLKQATVAKVASEAAANKASAVRDIAEAQAKPEEVRAKMLAAASTNLPNEDDMIAAEFDRRMKVAELMLKEADLDNNTKIVELQMNKTVADASNGKPV